jgi:aminopeptidase N
MKPTLKAPLTKRFKLYHGKLLSTSAFTFKLRRYTKMDMIAVPDFSAGAMVRRCSLTLSNPY